MSPKRRDWLTLKRSLSRARRAADRELSVFGVGAVGGGLYVPAARNSIFSAAADMADSRDQFEAILSNTSEYMTAVGRLNSRTAKPAYLLVVTATDAIGLIADVCEPLVALECNVERAQAWSIAGRHVLMTEISTKLPEEAEAPTPVTQHDIESTLRNAGFGVRWEHDPDRGTAQVVTLLPLTPDWHRQQSTLCRYRADLSEAPGRLLEITRVIAEYDAPIVTFSAWVEDASADPDLGPRCRSNFWLELMPDQVDEAGRALREVAAADATGESAFDHDVVYDPAPPGLPAVAYEGNPAAFTAVGFARPGFVHTALSALDGLNVTAASMAVLGAYTCLVVVVDLPDGAEPATVKERLESDLHRFDAETAAPDLSTVLHGKIEAVSELSVPVTVTHDLIVTGPDRPGVLAAVTRAAQNASVNIVRMDAQVIPAVDPRCSFEVRLLLHVPADRVSPFERLLVDLRENDNDHVYEFQLRPTEPEHT